MNENKSPFDESLVSAYLDGELSDEEKREVESAMRNTPALQTLVRELSAVRSLVASTALKLEKPTRSLQSPEWLVPNTNSSVSANDDLSKPQILQQGMARNRIRFSIGLVGSLAAIALIFISTKLLIDAQPDNGMQIVMDGNAPGSMAAAPPQMKSTGTNENPDFSAEAKTPMAPAVAQGAMTSNTEILPPPLSAEPLPKLPPVDPKMAVSTVPKISNEAKEFLSYLEQKLNSKADTTESDRWRFKTENETITDALADRTFRGRTSSVNETMRDVDVELVPALDEIILQVTEEEAKEILKLGNIGSELIDEISPDQELLAIATLSITDGKLNQNARSSNAPAAKLLAGDRERKWTIDFTPQSANSVPVFASGATANAYGGGSGAGGQGSDPNEDQQRNLSNTRNATDPSPKGSAKRSIERFSTQPASPTKASQLDTEQSSQVTQPANSTKMTTESNTTDSPSEKTPSGAKIMRIRIKIKKELSSSGSSE